jgi:hypothetical protein
VKREKERESEEKIKARVQVRCVESSDIVANPESPYRR